MLILWYISILIRQSPRTHYIQRLFPPPPPRYIKAGGKSDNFSKLLYAILKKTSSNRCQSKNYITAPRQATIYPYQLIEKKRQSFGL